MQEALDLVDGWPVGRAAVAVLGGHAQLGTRGPADWPAPWASVTKLATALAVLVATEEGTLHLDAEAGPPGSTVRHLLAHASGLAFDRDTVIARPGRRRIYSNRGFDVLADTLAAAAGMPFADYLAEAVLEPLAMTATTLDGSAAAGITGPLADLAKLAAELARPTLLSPATMAAATTVAFPGLPGVLPGIGPQPTNDWGLGFELRDHKSPHWTGSRNSPATFGHFGATGSFLWVDPVAGLACAGLTDRTFGPWALEHWPRLADAILARDGP